MADNDQATKDPKDDNKQDDKPTEQQVKTANELEQAKWQGDFKEEELAVPYKREEEDNGAGDGKDTEKTESKVQDNGEAAEQAAEEEVAEYTEPEPVVTVQDPGTYQPADYSFEVTLKDGKTVKIATPEEADTIAEDPDNFTTPKQLLDFIKKSNRMALNLERDREKWEADRRTFEQQQATQAERTETITTLASEFEYLVGKKMLPPIDPQYKDADWADPEVAKQPGVKEQLALLDYMVKENEQRAKAKVRPLTSVLDAYNAWKLDQTEQQAIDDKKAEGEARKTAGSRVAGVSASNQSPYIPKGIAVGNPGVMRRGGANWED